MKNGRRRLSYECQDGTQSIPLVERSRFLQFRPIWRIFDYFLDAIFFMIFGSFGPLVTNEIPLSPLKGIL